MPYPIHTLHSGKRHDRHSLSCLYRLEDERAYYSAKIERIEIVCNCNASSLDALGLSFRAKNLRPSSDCIARLQMLQNEHMAIRTFRAVKLLALPD